MRTLLPISRRARLGAVMALAALVSVSACQRDKSKDKPGSTAPGDKVDVASLGQPGPHCTSDID